MIAGARRWAAYNLGFGEQSRGTPWPERALLWLVAANLVVFVAETVPGIAAAYGPHLALFEHVSIGIFVAEYLARLWACVEDPRYREPLAGRLRWMRSPLALLDLLVLLPYLMPRSVLDLRVTRTLRLFRLFRSVKLVRYSRSLRTLLGVLAAKREELLVTLSFALTLLLFSASALYFIEREAQPEAFSSIPAAMWWAVTTLTTVGYGDVYPVTPLGRLVGAAIAMIGVGLFALPAGILAAGFTERIQGERDRLQSEAQAAHCPHCGQKL